MEKFKMSSKG